MWAIIGCRYWVLIAGLSFVFVVSACSRDDDDDDETTSSGLDLSGELPARDQCFNVVNGTATMAFPSVVLLFRFVDDLITSRCTGTFVGHNTVITAAHCVGSDDNGGMAYAKEDCATDTTTLIEATDVFHHGITSADFSAAEQNLSITIELQAQDLAVLIFPDNTSEDVSSIAAVEPLVGDTVTMVGYGIDVTADDINSLDPVAFPDITKRVGTNELDDAEDSLTPSRTLVSGRNRTESADAVAGTESIIASGDSGGPLFFDSAIVGVASTAGISQNEAGDVLDQSAWVNLFSSLSVNVLQTAVDGGAVITGFDEFLD